MATLLQVDFDFPGPFGEELSTMLEKLAESINEEAGSVSYTHLTLPTTPYV